MEIPNTKTPPPHQSEYCSFSYDPDSNDFYSNYIYEQNETQNFTEVSAKDNLT